MRNLREARRARDVRAEDVAEATGIDIQRWYRIERGDTKATADEAVAIARFLGTTVETLTAPTPEAV